MASFTDNPSGQQFSEYVPPVNLELYAGILAKRQQEYDQGVQKVQGYLDTVAGLPVDNEHDKAYLQSKVTELNNQINQYAGSDFSNTGIVSKIGSMASKLYSDPIIQTAVASAANVKAALKDAETAKDTQKGWGPENVWALQTQIQQWRSSTKPGVPFTGSYTPYVDASKMVSDELEKLVPNTKAYQDPSGNYKLLVEGTNEEIAPEKVRSLVEGILGQNSTIRDQLQISAAYTFRNHTPEQLQTAVARGMAPIKQSLDQRIKALEHEATISAGDSQKINQINSLLTDLRLQSEQFDTRVQELQASALSDPETMKAYLFRENFINTAVGKKTYSKVSSKLVESPEYKINQENLKNFLEYEQNKKDYALEQAKHQLAVDQFEWEKTHPKGTKGDGTNGSGSAYPNVPGGSTVIDAGAPTAQANVNMSARLHNRVAELEQSISDDEMNMLANLDQSKPYFRSFARPGANGTTDYVYTFAGKTEAEQQANRVKAQEEFIKLKQQYSQGADLDPRVRNFFDKHFEAVQERDRLKQIDVQVTNEWKSRNKELFNAQPEFAYTSRYRDLPTPDVKLTTAHSGKPFTPTKEDILNAFQRINTRFQREGKSKTMDQILDSFGSQGMDERWDFRTRETLKPIVEYLRENFYRPAAASLAQGKPLTGQLKALTELSQLSTDQNLKDIVRDAKNIDQVASEAETKFRNTELKKYLPGSTDPGQLFPTAKPENAKHFRSVFREMSAEINKAFPDIREAGITNDQWKTAQAILADDKEYSATFHAGLPGQKPYVQITGSVEGELKTGTIPMTEAQARHYNFANLSPATHLQKMLNLGTERQTSNSVTQNAKGLVLGNVPGATKGAGNRYYVTYDVNNTDGVYTVTVHAHDRKDGGKPWTIPIKNENPLTSPEQVMEYLNNTFKSPFGEALITANKYPNQAANPGGDSGANPYMDPTNPLLMDYIKMNNAAQR